MLNWTPAIGQLIDLSLLEDMSSNDVTSDACGVAGRGVGRVVCREAVVVCGLDVAAWVCSRGEPSLVVEPAVHDGAALAAGAELLRLRGEMRAILRVERTVLNFLMRLCGVATLTQSYVRAVEGTGAKVVDTRKTLPGWRTLDKYAVRIGGGANHRMDLGSGMLIKDNHIAACGSVAAAVQRARRNAPHTLRIEVEVENQAQVQEALAAGAEVLLLDNMRPDGVRAAKQLIGTRAVVEVSGGVTLSTIRSFAEAGADLISVGALTHSVRGVDLSLELEQEGVQ